MITARPYQLEAKRCVFKEWESNSSTLTVMPVGTGKTHLFAMVIADIFPKRALVIAERRELIHQARDKITRVTGLDCGIEMGDKYVNNSLFGDMPVVISTIQTQISSHGDRRRMSRFNPKDFGVLVIDECHHSTAKSYKDLINYYRTQNPDIKILGVTATPDRADEKALGTVFDSVAYNYEMQDAVHDGWLVYPYQQFVYIAGLDFSHIRTTAGDLNGADLAEVMEAEKNLHGVASATVGIIKNKRTLVFTASVKQAEMLANIFNRHRAGMADWVCGKTNEDKRAHLLRQFQAGDIQVMVNCNCLSEGYDDPGVEVVVQARPTKSRSLYAQQIGRCARPLPGVVDGKPTAAARKLAIGLSKKPGCLVLDFVGNSGKHKLISMADVLGGKFTDEVLERAKQKARDKPVRMDAAIDEAEEEIRKEAEERRKQEEARKARLVAKVRFTAKAVNPFDWLDIQPLKERGWDKGRHLSEKQKNFLLRQGINPDQLSYAEGKQLLNEIFRRFDNGLASPAQCKALRKYGYDVKHLKREDASKLLDQLAANNWKKTSTITAPKREEDNVPF